MENNYDKYFDEIVKTGRLSLISRKELWLKIGPLASEGEMNSYKLKRYNIAEKTVKYAYSVLKDEEIKLADSVLSCAELYLSKKKDIDETIDVLDEYMNEILIHIDKNELEYPCVGLAAINAIDILMFDELSFDLEDDCDDYDISPDSWDTSFSISMIISKGGCYSESYDIEQNRVFWKWYLNEIIGVIETK